MTNEWRFVGFCTSLFFVKSFLYILLMLVNIEFTIALFVTVLIQIKSITMYFIGNSLFCFVPFVYVVTIYILNITALFSKLLVRLVRLAYFLCLFICQFCFRFFVFILLCLVTHICSYTFSKCLLVRDMVL